MKPKPGIPVFDDHKATYWDKGNPTGSVKIADTNTRIKILKELPGGSTMTVQVGPSAS